MLSRIFSWLDAWRAKYDEHYVAPWPPSSMYEGDPDIEFYQPLSENEHVQKLQELLRLVKDPIEEMWERPCLIDTESRELNGEW